MKRKLIKQGTGNGLALYVPKEWIDERNLQAKDEVDIEINNSELIIRSNTIINTQKNCSITIESNFSDKVIKNYVYALYRQGFDYVEIYFSNKKQLQYIKKIVRETLLGFEITDEFNKKCIIESITEPSYEKFDQILRKIFVIIKNDMKESFSNIINNVLENNLKLEENRKMIDDYTNFCRRLILKNSILQKEISHNYYVIISRLSIIAHSYYYLIKNLQTLNLKQYQVSNDLIEEINKTQHFFELFYTLFYTKQQNKINDLLDNIELELRNSSFLITDSKLLFENLIYNSLIEIQRQIQLNITNLYGIILEEQL